MEVAHILENKDKGFIYGLMGNVNLSTNNGNISIVNDYKFLDTVQNYLNSEKASSSLKMVMLNDTYLNKTIKELSNGDIKKISLAKALIDNKEVIALDFFDKGLNSKELEEYKRMFKKLSNDIHKTILIYTNNIEFLWDICERVIYVDNNKVINTYKKDDYNELLELVNKPEIIKFTNLMKEKNIKVEGYKDVKDLLKAIYRLKEQEK